MVFLRVAVLHRFYYTVILHYKNIKIISLTEVKNAQATFQITRVLHDKSM